MGVYTGPVVFDIKAANKLLMTESHAATHVGKQKLLYHAGGVERPEYA